MSLLKAISAGIVLAGFAVGQDGGLTLRQAVESALRNYPSIRVSQEQVNAASAAIQLARTAYLPKVDTVAQVNRATRNNVFGVLLPQQTLPSLSGPVIGSNNFGTVWGSAVGGTVTWEPFDFGLRRANVAVATAAKAESEATVKRTQFEVAVTVVDAYLTLVAAGETVRAAEAGVVRAKSAWTTISAVVGAQLRPGADQSRAEAELAAAQTQLIQAQQAVDIARVNLAQFTGGEPVVSPATFHTMPPEQTPAAMTNANPVIVEQSAAVEKAREELKALARSYFPRFYVQGSAWARGSGAEINGIRMGGLNGLAPTYQNYAAGLTVTFPAMDLPAIRAKEAQQAAIVKAQSARSEQVVLELRAQWNRSVAALHGARRIAANTPVQVAAAKTTLQQATARYQAGLGNIDEVAVAQRLLTQAEMDDSLARLSVWRALLGIATASGDLQPFIEEASR